MDKQNLGHISVENLSSLFGTSCLKQEPLPKTKLLQAGFGDYPGDPLEKGARTSVYLASSPEVEGVTGQYFEDCQPVRSSPLSYDRQLQWELWRIKESLTQVG